MFTGEIGKPRLKFPPSKKVSFMTGKWKIERRMMSTQRIVYDGQTYRMRFLSIGGLIIP